VCDDGDLEPQDLRIENGYRGNGGTGSARGVARSARISSSDRDALLHNTLMRAYPSGSRRNLRFRVASTSISRLSEGSQPSELPTIQYRTSRLRDIPVLQANKLNEQYLINELTCDCYEVTSGRSTDLTGLAT
jgi:hypothetical protein